MKYLNLHNPYFALKILFNVNGKTIVCDTPLVYFVCHNKISLMAPLGTIGKRSMSKGALNWFYNVSTYGEEIIEY